MSELDLYRSIYNGMGTAVSVSGVPLRGTSADAPFGADYHHSCRYAPVTPHTSSITGINDYTPYKRNEVAYKRLLAEGQYKVDSIPRIRAYAALNTHPELADLNLALSRYQPGTVGFLGETASICLGTIYYAINRRNDPIDKMKVPDYFSGCVLAGIGPSFIASIAIAQHPELENERVTADDLYAVTIKTGLLASNDEDDKDARTEICAAPHGVLKHTFNLLLGQESVSQEELRTLIQEFPDAADLQNIIGVGRLAWETRLIQARTALGKIQNDDAMTRLNQIADETAIILGYNPEEIVVSSIPPLSRVPSVD